jgi:pimeloyl-ACP methyl ester carboxylesterase
MSADPARRTARARGRRGLIAVLALVATGFVAVPAATATPSAPAAVAQPHAPTPAPIAWGPCPAAPAPYECGTVTVPADHARPGRTTRAIAVIRLPAQGPGPSLGPLVVNPGGPGTSGVAYLPQAVPLLFGGLSPRFDIVSFDPRGVGASGPVGGCVDDADRDAAYAATEAFPDRADIPAIAREAAELVWGCTAEHGARLGELSTATAARDMDAIRAALGVEQVSYLGFSYGSYLGATYASLFPDRLRAIVLDGAVDPDQTANDPLAKDVEQAQGFDVALDRFLAWCDATPTECAFAGGASARFDALLAAVGTTPLPAPLNDPTRPVTDHTVVTGVQATLYARLSWPFLGQALLAAEQGDGSALQLASDQFIGREPDGTYSSWFDAFTAVVAVDRDHPASLSRFAQAADRAAQVAPTFGRLNVWSSLPSALWVVPPREDVEGPFTYAPAAGAPPALVVGTTYDTATPYRGAEAMTAQLGHATLLTLDGDGHTAYGRGGGACLDGAVDAYLIDLVVPAAGTTCPQATAAPAATTTARGAPALPPAGALAVQR